jgi:hypothetical protein
MDIAQHVTNEMQDSNKILFHAQSPCGLQNEDCGTGSSTRKNWPMFMARFGLGKKLIDTVRTGPVNCIQTNRRFIPLSLLHVG